MSSDELLNGFNVLLLPFLLARIEIKMTDEYVHYVKYEEVPNWFVSLKEGEEVDFGLYDEGKKDYSYHISINNRIFIHGKEGYEMRVEEYDQTMTKSNVYSLIVQEENDEIFFIGKISYQNNTKFIESFKDKSFLKS